MAELAARINMNAVGGGAKSNPFTKPAGERESITTAGTGVNMDGDFVPLVRKATTRNKKKAAKKKKVAFDSDDDMGFGGMQSAFKN